MSTSLSPQTILIADDAESQRSLIEILLSSNHLNLVSVANGKEVLEYLRTNTPNLALLDSDMPYLGGFDICSKMKRIRRLTHVPVVVMTPPHDLDEAAAEQSRQLAQMVQVDLVIQKPLSDKNLRRQVVDLLQASQARASEAPPAVMLNIPNNLPSNSPSNLPSSHVAQDESAATTMGAMPMVEEQNLDSTILIENALAGMHTLHGTNGQGGGHAFPQASAEQKIALLESENKLLRKQVDELDREVRELRQQLGKMW